MIKTSYVYLLHFDCKLSHAQHYAGCTAALKKRLEAHANGHGSRLMQELMSQGLTWRLGGLYSCSHAEMRRHEKALKAFKNGRAFCQLCNPIGQHRLIGCQTENVNMIPFPTDSPSLTTSHVDIAGVHEMTEETHDEEMKFITNLMKKDKDALGFVPVGGVSGIRSLMTKRQIVLATENAELCGYAFYTLSMNKETVNIHQACIDDQARLKGHGRALIETIAQKYPGSRIIAKVRDDLAANHFWTAMGFQIELTKKHKTSGSTIHHYERKDEK